MFQQPKMEQAPALRPMVNVGAGLDVITGKILYGKHGEAILVGGAPPTVGVVGTPNVFKSAFIRHMSLTILARIKSATVSWPNSSKNCARWKTSSMPAAG
jgi:hypothetical protein